MVKVLFLIEGWISPAPRYRVLQYLPYLVEEGVFFKVRSLQGNRYPAMLGWPLIGNLLKFLIRIRRLFHIRDAASYDVVFQQRMTLPFSAMVERLLVKKNPNLVFDFDDAIYQEESGPNSRRMAAFQKVTALSKVVVAGSEYLASKTARDTTVIPTVIDTDVYIPKRTGSESLVIGWMGTASNFPNFKPLFDNLADLLERHPKTILRIVADRPPEFFLPRMEFKAWHKEREVSDLQSFHIGIMPLIDSHWNRGKCAFKLIQYMAVGIPVVAGKVGANCEVVDHEKTGFLAESPQQFETALQRLIGNNELRKNMGVAGRNRCVERYSLEKHKQRFLQSLRKAAAPERDRP